MKTILSLLTAIAALVLPAQLHAATVPVTITINSVFNISAGHAWGQPPDFYAQIWIDRASVRTPTVSHSNGFTSPAGWTFTRNVSRAQRGGIALVRIELRDMDALVDIDPAGCMSSGPFGCAELSVTTPPVDSFGIDVALNLFDGSWAPRDPTGDSSVGPATSGNPQMACTTGAGTKVANICFTITVGTPSPETLTVSKTADSDRAFCAPGDCSLREAITRAESLDTVQLPASTAPYLLDVFGNVHLAIRQAPLYVSGPKNGGTAVIRQKWGDFRVFDVHAGANLVLDHVSLTGGGAGPTSTAFPAHIHGGAIHNHGTIELTYVTITGNSALDPTDTAAAPGGGGGIYNATGATAKLTNVTIAGNVAAFNSSNMPLGGGIAGSGTFTLRNTVIANNVANNVGTTTASNCGLGIGKPTSIIDEGGNLQFPGNDCGRLVTITLPRTGTSHTFWAPFFPTAVFDPLLPLDAVRTIFLPAPNGPAVDSGVAGCGPTDQAGRPAPRDGNGDGVVACDAGAMEAP